MNAPNFDAGFRARLADLVAWRRDVRRFKTDPVSEKLVEELLDLAQLAPSVGNSQPWRWRRVESAGARAQVRASFERCNAAALEGLGVARANAYARLKLEGLDRAPLQFAVFCDHSTAQGHGLGCVTMRETLDYSVVGQIATLWFSARAAGLGLGWLSILEPEAISAAVGAPPPWKFIAYLCLGYPEEEHVDPELQRYGWQDRTAAGRRVDVV